MNICNLWSLPSFSNLTDWLKKKFLQKPKVYPDTSIFDGLVMITISVGARMFFFWNMSSTWTISSHPARSIELAQTEGLTLLMAPQIFVKHKKRSENVFEEKIQQNLPQYEGEKRSTMWHFQKKRNIYLFVSFHSVQWNVVQLPHFLWWSCNKIKDNYWNEAIVPSPERIMWNLLESKTWLKKLTAGRNSFWLNRSCWWK